MIYSWDDGTAGSRRVQITPILAIDDNTIILELHIQTIAVQRWDLVHIMIVDLMMDF